MSIPEKKPTVGAVVHFTLQQGRSAGEVRAGIVVRVWDSGVINMQLFVDGTNDQGAEGPWLTSVHYDAAGERGTWNWPAA